jgi:single-stranded DNA-binding protein
MRGLPHVTTIGYLAKDAIYHKVNERGGYINFSIGCTRIDYRDGDPNPACYYQVKYWIKDDSKLPGFLSKGVPVYIQGYWEANRSGDNVYNQIVAEQVQLLPSGKKS